MSKKFAILTTHHPYKILDLMLGNVTRGLKEMASSCEHGNEHPGSITYVEFLNKLSDYWLLKKDCSTEFVTD
jgi:hypothetical protein